MIHAPRRPLPTRRRLVAALGAGALLLAACTTTPVAAPPPPPGLSPVQQTALRDLGFVEADANWNLDLAARVNFGVDTAAIGPDELALLTRVAQTLLGVGIDRLAVEGHTDNQGSDAYNMRLAERRAAAVADALAARGFDAANITRRAMGASRPVADNTTAAGRLLNRRAVLIVPSL